MLTIRQVNFKVEPGDFGNLIAYVTAFCQIDRGHPARCCQGVIHFSGLFAGTFVLSPDRFVEAEKEDIEALCLDNRPKGFCTDCGVMVAIPDSWMFDLLSKAVAFADNYLKTEWPKKRNAYLGHAGLLEQKEQAKV